MAGDFNVTVRYNTVAVDGHGDGRLSRLTLKDRTSGATETAPATALFILIGAEPHTGWLPDTLRRDRWEFVGRRSCMPASCAGSV